MIGGKSLFFVGLLMIVSLRSTIAQTVNSTRVAAPNVTDVTTTQIPPQVATSTEQSLARRVLSALWLEITRRRTERTQRQQERREEILRDLDDLGDRKREFELRRQESQRDAQTEQDARRQEMLSRRAGRLPQRERERYNRLRLEKLSRQAPPPVEENEIDDSVPLLDEVVEQQELGGGGGQRVRNLLLIEEGTGNVRLIDLDTEEGRKLVAEKRAGEAEVSADTASKAAQN
ncbi:ensconsin-like [Anopheles cruzii]|uniref:ensconsin-like n=1 Tax=Anopheles cruzii TaxID=68878 RepID=UPI0022EC244C|nr:ensconsin-like [Anopheles cruzii]